MTTAIIGTAGIGSVIARQLASGREALRLSSADHESARTLAAEIGRAADAAADNRDALQGADDVVLALRFTALKGVITEIADSLTGKLVLVPSNPLSTDAQGNVSRLLPQGQPSGEVVAGWLLLHIFLRVVEQTLRQSSPGAGPRARLGAVSFLHRFGSALNPHVHFHCVVIDGLFQPDADGRVCFHEAVGLTQKHIAQVQEQVRRRVLRVFVRRGLLEPEAARNMRAWEGSGGFSVDGSIRVEAHDRLGLERLLRYCARPPFALERLAPIPGREEAFVYRLPKALPDGKTQLRLTPLELLDRLAVLIPPPRVHRHRLSRGAGAERPLAGASDRDGGWHCGASAL